MLPDGASEDGALPAAQPASPSSSAPTHSPASHFCFFMVSFLPSAFSGRSAPTGLYSFFSITDWEQKNNAARRSTCKTGSVVQTEKVTRSRLQGKHLCAAGLYCQRQHLPAGKLARQRSTQPQYASAPQHSAAFRAAS